MKVGNTIGGLEVVDVKRVNKLNLIQFLKEVDSYLQRGYQIDVNSGRQVGLVLQVDLYKVEQPFGRSGSAGSVGEQITAESVEDTSKEVVAQQDDVTTESVEETPVTPKKTTTRSKKTTQ